MWLTKTKWVYYFVFIQLKKFRVYSLDLNPCENWEVWEPLNWTSDSLWFSDS